MQHKDIKRSSAHGPSQAGPTLDDKPVFERCLWPKLPSDEGHEYGRRRKRRPLSSLGSSYLEAAVMPGQDSGTVLKHKLPMTTNDSPKPTSATSQRLFTKRARHKTRENLYEPKETTLIARQRAERKSKRHGRGKMHRMSKKTGQDVMENFSSKSIAQDRLTVSLPKDYACCIPLIIAASF